MAPLGDRLGAGRRVRVRAEFEERVLVGPQRGSPAFAPTDHEADDVAMERERFVEVTDGQRDATDPRRGGHRASGHRPGLRRQGVIVVRWMDCFPGCVMAHPVLETTLA